MKRALFAAVVFTCLSSHAADAEDVPATALMLNPGFEIQAGGWPTEWSIRWGNRAHFEWAADCVHSGTHSLKLTGPGCVESPAYPYNGEAITVSAWLKLDRLRQPDNVPRWYRAGVQVISLDKNRKPDGHKDLILTLGTQDWTHYRKQFIFPSSTKYVRVSLVYYARCTGTAWFDDVQILSAEDWYRPTKRPFDKDKATVTIDTSKRLGKLPEWWRNVDNSYMNNLVRPEVASVLPLFKQAGLGSVRLHETIYGPRIYRERDGEPIYDWTLFDRAIDLLMEHGMKPFVVLESTPNEMAAEQVQSYRNISKVIDLQKWEELIYYIVKHCVERYGRNEVLQWHFELWNEPDASGYYKGTLDDYLSMYDHTVKGATRAEPGIKIGGCGGAGNGWILPLAEHCAHGTNAATGETGTRIDFFSWHIYCAGVGVPHFDVIERSILQVKQQLARFPQFEKTPIIISEWSCNSSPAEQLDTSYRAPFILKALLKMHELGVQRAHSFVICDYLYDDNRKLFNRRLGFFTCAGVPKAPFHLFTMLNRLKGIRVAAHSSNDPIDSLAAFDEERRELRVILGNYMDDPGESFETNVALHITSPALAGRRASAAVTRVTLTESNAYDDWDRQGRPQVTKSQLIAYREGKRETEEQRRVAALIDGLKANAALAPASRSTLQFDARGRANMQLSMPVFSVYLVELSAE